MQKTTTRRRVLFALTLLFVLSMLVPFAVPHTVEAAPSEAPQAQVCKNKWRTHVSYQGTYIDVRQNGLASTYSNTEILCGYVTWGTPNSIYTLNVPCPRMLPSGITLAPPWGVNCKWWGVKYVQVLP